MGGGHKCQGTLHCRHDVPLTTSKSLGTRVAEVRDQVPAENRLISLSGLTSECMQGLESVPYLPVEGPRKWGSGSTSIGEGPITFSAGLRVGPGGPSGAEEALPALPASFRGVGAGAEPAPIIGSTRLQAAQPRHRAVGARRRAGLPVELCPFRAVETCEGAGPRLGPE